MSPYSDPHYPPSPITAASYSHTLDFFRTEMGASGCIDDETRERVYQCVAKHAVETLGNSSDVGDVELFLAYGDAFPFTMRCYDFGKARFDEDCETTAAMVRGLIEALREDGYGKNYSVVEGSRISWTARTDHYSFYVSNHRPRLFVNGKREKCTKSDIDQRLDACLAPPDVIELWEKK